MHCLENYYCDLLIAIASLGKLTYYTNQKHMNHLKGGEGASD